MLGDLRLQQAKGAVLGTPRVETARRSAHDPNRSVPKYALENGDPLS